MKLKSNINIILPIVLVATLPIISFYANPERAFAKEISFGKGWFFASSLLYILWHILWSFWNLKFRYRITLGLGIGIILLMLYFFVLQNLQNFESYHILRFILTCILFLAIQFSLKAQDNISRLLLEKEQMQTENYKVQFKALRTQTDPHFLFNSLNTLRSMVRQNHDNSEKFVMSLADFYRQTLKHNENTRLQLSEELVVLESYLFLMKSRNEKAISINLDIDEALYTYHLPTLALQTVVENCFKHNSMTSKMPLHIEIKNFDSSYITITNNIQAKIGNQDSSGYGLELLKKRYELMNIKEGIMIEKTAQEFMVKLKLIRE